MQTGFLYIRDTPYRIIIMCLELGKARINLENDRCGFDALSHRSAITVNGTAGRVATAGRRCWLANFLAALVAFSGF